MQRHFPLESLLSARQLLVPQFLDDYLYFLSDMGGAFSLYRMRKGGSIPEPLLPAGSALQNPHLMIGESFVIFHEIKRILVMIDNNGDENYQPSFVPLEGGIPEPMFDEKYLGQKLACIHFDRKANVAYFYHDDRKTPDIECLKVNVDGGDVRSLGTSIYGNYCAGATKDHRKVILIDGYTADDNILYLWEESAEKRVLLYGVPLEKRKPGKEYPRSGINTCNFVSDEKALLFRTSLLDDHGSLACLRFDDPTEIVPVRVTGLRHRGAGELIDVKEVDEGRYLLIYNVEGCSWVYEGSFQDGGRPRFTVTELLIGIAPVSNGVELGVGPQVLSGRKKLGSSYVFSFAAATSPSQLFTFNPKAARGKRYAQVSSEHVLGIDRKYLSKGEDATYESFDGLDINARLYLPSRHLGLKPPYPLVLYVHGGPQSQERPDFTWFSMPLIQYLTLNGVGVFVPNVRGSTGYGLSFMKMVDRDWGGKDALDHVEGLKKLEKDDRIDSSRRGVIGRSYGGYMTLWLVSRFPDMWRAGVDMFGPYNLVTFIERLPPSWRTNFYLSVGHPEKDKQFLVERSPATHMDNVKCPMLMIQGGNDPRVVQKETSDVVERLRSRGIAVEYLVFEDEGHDVIKLKNRITCYSKITAFFLRQLANS